MSYYSKIVALDPSGNFDEGKGTTGIAISDGMNYKFMSISAKHFKDISLYWNAVLDVLREEKPDCVVMEEFRLISNVKRAKLVGSTLETPQLIGVITHYCNTRGIKLVMQSASNAKARFSNKILTHLGDLTYQNGRYYIHGLTINGHSLDAYRHLKFFIKYGKRKGGEKR